MAGRVITFYSYKGGTGRTMALANTAVLLARERRARVLAIDWDLEAPGLHRFLDSDEVPDRPGLIELLADARDRLSTVPREERSRMAEQVLTTLPLDDHTTESGIPSLQIMRAGRMDADYADRVNGFDWQALYDDAPELFGRFAALLAARWDYVLIDSRTGITDASGICTMLMPDRLVVVFTPNRQSLAGVVDLVRRATDYRRRSDDLRPLVAYPLASRVELSEEELRRTWRHGDEREARATSTGGDALRIGYQPTFERLFREVYDLPSCDLEAYFDEVQIQHAARFAYGEPLAVIEESASDRLSLARSYASFVRILAEPDGPWAYRQESQPTRVPAADPGAASADVGRMIEALTRHNRRARRNELTGRTLQGVCLLVGFAIAVLWYESYQVSYLAAGIGAATAIVVELFLRTFRFMERSGSYARAAAALAREQRLFDACAGPYGAADAPAALLAERTDEVLATIDEAAWIYRRPPLSRRRP